MQKKLVISLFIISFIVALFFTVLSLGWLIIVFGLIAAVAIILHVTAGALSIKALPASANLLVLSALCFVVLALLKYDLDDVGVYSGFSQFVHLIGLSEEPYIELTSIHQFFFILLLIAQVVIDFLLIRMYGWKKKNNTI